MEEHDAIERLQRGDVGGLALLVRRYQVRAVRVAYLVTHDLALAEDVVQTAFVKAYERIEQFDLARPFGPWFLASVLNDARRAATRHARLVPLNVDDADDRVAGAGHMADDQPGPELRWEQAETAEELAAALRQLTPKERAAVVCRYYLGLSEAEMARALDCTTGTIKWRLHAARERLRRLLRATPTTRLENTDARARHDSTDESDRRTGRPRPLGSVASDSSARRREDCSPIG
jgi:RNA polymerase sigma-70 factor (ECF subfamily)